MPTYQYACTECGHRLEAVQSFSDDPLTVCPDCQGRLRKLFSSVGVVFKGSGFYRTDSRASATISAENGANGSKSPTESSSKDSSSKDSSKSSTDSSSSSSSSAKDSSSSGSTGKKEATTTTS